LVLRCQQNSNGLERKGRTFQPELRQLMGTDDAKVLVEMTAEPRAGSAGIAMRVRRPRALRRSSRICGSRLRREQLLLASFSQRRKYHLAASGIHLIRRLIHPLQPSVNPPGIGFDQTAAWQVVSPIDRTRCMAVQMAAVTRKRNQISHSGAIGVKIHRSLWSRLSRSTSYAQILGFGPSFDQFTASIASRYNANRICESF